MPQQENVNVRLKSFKNRGRDADEMRRRRAEVNVELRKQKKEDHLLKRRNVCEDDEDALSPLRESNKLSQNDLEEIIADMDSNVAHLQVQATQKVRKILSRERRPPINEVIKAGIVPKLVTFLDIDDNSVLQFEAAWALTNIASGTSEQTKVVVDAQAVPAFTRLLSSSKQSVAEQAVWALGNIAGDGPPMRDYVISCGVIKPLLVLIESGQQYASLFRNVIWTMSNLCRAKNPPPPPEVRKAFLPVIIKILHCSTDITALGDACWALSHITDTSEDGIEYVVQSGVIPSLVQMLSSKDPNIITPSLRAIGNIVTGNDSQTQAVINGGAITPLKTLLVHPKLNIQKEAAWTISNITAGTPAQIEAIVNCEVVPMLVQGLQHADIKVQKEIVWAITNFTSSATPTQMSSLLNAGALSPYCKLLSCKDPKMVQLILDGLNNVLALAEKYDQLDDVCLLIEECGGLDLIENCQKHSNEVIYNAALELIEKYFSGEDDEDPEIAPASNEDAFEFPMTSPTGGFSL